MFMSVTSDDGTRILLKNRFSVCFLGFYSRLAGMLILSNFLSSSLYGIPLDAMGGKKKLIEDFFKQSILLLIYLMTF
jgi:hypothetical protein